MWTAWRQETDPARSDPQTLQLVTVVTNTPECQVCGVHAVVECEGLELRTKLSQLTHTLV